MKLTKKQTLALDILEDNTTNELIFGGGAGGAKSVLGCYWGLKMSLKYPGIRGVIGRETLKTLKETTLNSLFWVFQQQGIKTHHYKFNSQSNIFKFYNGSEIMLKDLGLYPSDPNFDELGSLEITWSFVDECNQVVKKAWDILQSRLRYRLDENGLIPKQLGTCNPAKNWVYSNFYGPSKARELPENKKFIQSLLNDNPFISKHYRENLLRLDQSSKERLLYGNWEYDDDPAVLCDYDAILDMFTNDHVLPGEDTFISADLAMQGRDKFIAGSWRGMICSVDIDKGKSTGKEIEQDLKGLMVRRLVPHSKTVADSDGLGAYLESYLENIKTFHGGAAAVDNEYINLKSECGFKLAEVINKREIKVHCTQEQKQKIIEEIGVLKRDRVDADDTRKRIIKKDKMKELLGRSPDYLDMLLMRMYFVVQPQITFIRL